MKVNQFTKEATKHLDKLGLPYNKEGMAKEAQELIRHIKENKIEILLPGEVDAVFIELNESKDLEEAEKLADRGLSVTVKLPESVNIKKEKLEKFEAVIIDSNDIDKFDLGIKNLYVAFEKKPTKIELDFVFDFVKAGTLQIVNLETANNRRPNAKGYAPSVGALLDSYGSINVVAVDVSGFITVGTVENEDGTTEEAIGYDFGALFQAVALAVRANTRALLERTPASLKKVQTRDGVLGVSLKGFKAVIEEMKWDENQVDGLINKLQQVAHEEAMSYTAGLRLPLPMLVTTMEAGEVHHFDEYIRFQKFYTDHNTPATIYILEEEIESYKQLILDEWDWFISVDFKVVR